MAHNWNKCPVTDGVIWLMKWTTIVSAIACLSSVISVSTFEWQIKPYGERLKKLESDLYVADCSEVEGLWFGNCTEVRTFALRSELPVPVTTKP